MNQWRALFLYSSQNKLFSLQVPKFIDKFEFNLKIYKYYKNLYAY